ncbi:MAG TPA: dihydrolipoamide acetyltransferase family protein [Gammaproteobacteria bacterium]|nr:dihydrolipoamide acetyltransferase family protein [Gammaproteobacteria bacterium]
MKTFNLPDLGEGLQEAEIVAWHVKEGDVVKVDQPLVSVETAKAVVDVPSPYAGRIVKLHWKAGDIVPTHAPLVDFDIDGAAAKPAPAEKPRTAPPAREEPIAEDSGTVVGKMATSTEVVEETAIIRRKVRKGTGRPKAAPAVRAYAKQMGIDLTRVEGTGKGGLITRDDLARAGTAAARAAPAPRAEARPQPPPIAFGQMEPLRGPRRAMHASMTRARSEVMECTIFDDADIHEWQPGQDITARIIRALVAGVRAEPGFNAWYDGEKMARQIHERIDLAMAVDTPDGLIVPVLRDVGRKSLAELRADLDVIKEKTRSRTVAPEDMKNPTITLSNFGMMAGRYATPVVVPPTVAILGTGGIRYDVVPVMGGIEVHRRIPLSLTFDHRCLTGGEACRFLAAVIKDLQKPN